MPIAIATTGGSAPFAAPGKVLQASQFAPPAIWAGTSFPTSSKGNNRQGLLKLSRRGVGRTVLSGVSLYIEPAVPRVAHTGRLVAL